jgi:hypothetical protein
MTCAEPVGGLSVPAGRHDLVEDLTAQLRPATVAEWPAFARAMAAGFGGDASGAWAEA